MATVIRVKRRIDEEPLNAFVLNSKKRRFENIDDDTAAGGAAAALGVDGSDATATTVVKFAGTVQNQDDIASHIRKLSKAEAIDATNHVRQPSNVAARNRTAQRQHAQEDRFKIVNCFRTLNDQTLADDLVTAPASSSAIDMATSVAGGHSAEPTSRLTVVDIEKSDPAPESAAAAAAAPSEVATTDGAEPAQYVYDLYFPDAAEPNSHMDIFIEDLLSVEPLTYGSARDNGQPDTSDDSEDSNDEGNWRNDYPDTEEEDADDGNDGDNDSVDERDMRRAFGSMEMDDDLSSDDEDAAVVQPQSGFVYSIAEEESAGGSALHDSDVDEDDVSRYGEAYARYKARVLSRNQRADSDDEWDAGGKRNGADGSDADSDRLDASEQDGDNYYSD